MPKIHVGRAITIDSDPESVFKVISDFSTWSIWSPWLCAEPECLVSVSENSNSVGSTYEWEGKVVGAGKIEHVSLTAPHTIEEKLTFLKPYRSSANVRFELKPSGSGTEVNWVMDSSLPWFMFWMKSQFETFIGMDYERGLKMLKEFIETGNIQSTTKIVGVEDVEAMTVVGVRHTSSLDDIKDVMPAAYEEAQQLLTKEGFTAETDAVSVFHGCDMKTMTFDFTAGHKQSESTSNAAGSLSVWSIPDSKAFIVEHTGSYEHLGNAWSAAEQHVRANKLKKSTYGAFEMYLNDPKVTPDADRLTRIYIMVK